MSESPYFNLADENFNRPGPPAKLNRADALELMVLLKLALPVFKETPQTYNRMQHQIQILKVSLEEIIDE